MDLIALVLPSSTQLRRVLLHLSRPLQAVTPFAECYAEDRLATDLLVGLRGAGSPVLGPFCQPCSPLTLPLEPFVMQTPKPPGPHAPRLLCPPWGGHKVLWAAHSTMLKSCWGRATGWGCAFSNHCGVQIRCGTLLLPLGLILLVGL